LGTPDVVGGYGVHTVPVGAELAREGAHKNAKSFAGKPCSYRLGGVFNIPVLSVREFNKHAKLDF